MKIVDNRGNTPITESQVVYIDYLDNNHARINLFSGYSIYIDHDEFIRLACVLQPKPCVNTGANP